MPGTDMPPAPLKHGVLKTAPPSVRALPGSAALAWCHAEGRQEGASLAFVRIVRLLKLHRRMPQHSRYAHICHMTTQPPKH